MSKVVNIVIIASFAGLWVATLFSQTIELILGFFLIITFGIVHGSNDMLLINRLLNKEKKYSKLRSLLLYIATVVVAFIAFYFVPTLTLILFIGFSAYHFGEQHWEGRVSSTSKVFPLLFECSYGMHILSILFYFNYQEVIDVIQVITGHHIHLSFITTTLITAAALWSICVVFFISENPSFKRYLVKELFFLLLLSLIFKMSSLIWGFTMYFVLWHSLPSLYDQIEFIYGRVGRREIIRYLKNAFPYWLVSIVGIAASYFWLTEGVLFYAVFFSIIAAVTFPHALIITTMFKQKKIAHN